MPNAGVTYLYRLVEPPVARTIIGATTVDHLVHHVRLVPAIGQPVPLGADLAHRIVLRAKYLQVDIDDEQAPLDQRQVVPVGRTLHQHLPAVRPVVSLLRCQYAYRI